MKLTPFYFNADMLEDGPATLFAVFRSVDGDVYVEYAEYLLECADRFAANFNDDNCLGNESIAFIKDCIGKALPTSTCVISEESGCILVDSEYSCAGYASMDALSHELSGNEMFEKTLDDISLACELGHVAYGVLIGGKVVSAAYTISPLSDDDVCEIGVETVKEHMGKGFACDCVRALSEYLSDLGKTVMYSYYADNAASSAVAEKCGFVKISEGFEIIVREGNYRAV